MSVLKTAVKAVVTLVPASELARLGLPALWSVEALVVLVLIGIAWVVIDSGRSANLALILGRGRRREDPEPAPPPADRCDIHPVPVPRHARGGRVH